MNNIIEQMLSKYLIKNVNDEINALKEIIQIDYKEAKEDVLPFIKDAELNMWNKDFFISITQNLN